MIGPFSTAMTFALGTVPARNGRAAAVPAYWRELISTWRCTSRLGWAFALKYIVQISLPCAPTVLLKPPWIVRSTTCKCRRPFSLLCLYGSHAACPDIPAHTREARAAPQAVLRHRACRAAAHPRSPARRPVPRDIHRVAVVVACGPPLRRRVWIPAVPAPRSGVAYLLPPEVTGIPELPHQGERSWQGKHFNSDAARPRLRAMICWCVLQIVQQQQYAGLAMREMNMSGRKSEA